MSLLGWCVHKRGPLFASVFTPLMLVLVALAGSFLLDEKLHLGRYGVPPYLTYSIRKFLHICDTSHMHLYSRLLIGTYKHIIRENE